MFLVVVNTPDGRDHIPVSNINEAKWRAEFERRVAIATYGNDCRDDIGTRVEPVLL